MSGWLVLETVIIAYPVLVFGSCLVMEEINPSNLGLLKFKPINLIVSYGVPLMLVGLFVWAALKKKRP